MDTTPNYIDLGLSSPMGIQLRQLVEQQLVEDLKYYGIEKDNLKFDWSESCIEGHDTQYLDGWVENYSGIAVFDEHDKLVAKGWMDFVHEGNFFLVYWYYVTTWNLSQIRCEKRTPGIPDHIWLKIPEDIRWNYESERKRYTTPNTSFPK